NRMNRGKMRLAIAAESYPRRGNFQPNKHGIAARPRSRYRGRRNDETFAHSQMPELQTRRRLVGRSLRAVLLPSLQTHRPRQMVQPGSMYQRTVAAEHLEKYAEPPAQEAPNRADAGQ